ncbi:MAG: restriction endonuclease subunit S [Desulfitobacteriaceae bacterium]
MNEWIGSKLSDVIELIGGGTPKTTVPEYWNGNIPWLSVVDFNNDNRYVYQAEKHITEKGLNNSSTKLLRKRDLIISARGTVGALAQLSKPMAFNQSCYGIRAVDGLTANEYLYYLIKRLITELKQQTHGAVFDTITRETFNFIDVNLPPLPEQKAIASILSSLDDKIDLLNRQNKTLEALAETYFRQWFIEEAGEDWEDAILSDVVDVRDGTHDSPKPVEEGYYLITSKHLNENIIDFSSAYKISEDDFNDINKRSKVERYDILTKVWRHILPNPYVPRSPGHQPRYCSPK